MKKQTTVYLSEELRQQLRQTSYETETSQNSIINEALVEYLEAKYQHGSPSIKR